MGTTCLRSMTNHINHIHGISIEIYRQALTSSTIHLLRAELGFTTILNQCGWCLGNFDNSRKLGKHRNQCNKKPVEFNDRIKDLSEKHRKLLPKAKPTETEKTQSLPRNTKGVSYYLCISILTKHPSVQYGQVPQTTKSWKV